MSNPYAPPPAAPQRPPAREDDAAAPAGQVVEPAPGRDAGGDRPAAGTASGTRPADTAPGTTPQGTTPHGRAPHGTTPHGRAPQGTTPQGTTPHGRAPQAPRPPHPGARPGAPARPPLPPPDPAAVLRVGRLVRHFGVWLLAGVAVSLLPLPWRVATAAFLLGAVVTGIRALRAVAAARLRGGLLPLLVAGLALTGLLGAGTLGSFALWPAETARQECLSGALTVSARAACDRAYEDALDDLTGGLTGRP